MYFLVISLCSGSVVYHITMNPNRWTWASCDTTLCVLQELLNDSEVQDLVCEEAESTSQNTDMNNIQMDSGEPDNAVGVVEQSSTQSWTRRESQGAAGASTSLQQEFDYKDLEQEEKIARMKAKLRKSDAALNNLHPS